MSLVRLLLPLAPALGQFMAPAAGASAGEAMRGLGLQIGLGALVLVLGATAFGFGVAACYMALAVHYPTWQAAAFVAFGLLLLALLVVGVMSSIARSRALRRAQAQMAARRAAMTPVHQIAGQVNARPLQSLLVAAAVGAVAGWLDKRL